MTTETGSAASALEDVRTVAWNLALIATGCALCAAAINGILIPHQFLSGGFAGLALELHYLFPVLPVSATYLVLNLPLFALGWVYVGRRFFLYSLAGTLIFTGAVAGVDLPIPVKDPILAALLAGILTGTGAGVILRSQGSAGGADILSIILYQRFSVRLGTTILAFNALVLAGGAVLFSLEMALYTLIFMYVSSQLVNVVVTGLSQRKAVLIISRRWEEISRLILHEIRRGVTVLQGYGGFTGEDEKVLYSVITFRELARLKREIRALDPQAFVVVTETLEVMGHRIGNRPQW
ncbi:MAG: YitT family protein [Deferrisomatales bacterium]